MIPLQLTIKNFLSYREATLDFRGLHTACICGANGAGKSSLLEAIAWAIWGESRVNSEEDVIYAGAQDVRVDFIFQSQQQIYRTIRSRQRGGSTSLEFQIDTGSGFRSLTERGVRATQQLIIRYLKLDYETFINSAYLRQGRADEFMLKRPNERKQILADLLKLDRYEVLAEEAKDLSKQFKGQAEQLESSWQTIQTQLQQREATLAEKAELETQLSQLQQVQEADRQKLQQLQALFSQRQTWQQQLTWQQQQCQNLDRDRDRLQQEIAMNRQQQQQLASLIDRQTEIVEGYNQYLKLQATEESLSAKFQAYQEALAKKQQLQQQLEREINETKIQIRQAQTKLEGWQQQEKENLETLKRQGEVTAALEQLQRSRQRLAEFDELQLAVSPLLQHRLTLQAQLDRAHAKITAKLEELRSSARELELEGARQPQLQQTVLAVEAQIEELEKTRVYQQRVQEKGLERRNFQERLQEHQRTYEKQIAELGQKLEMLKTPDACCPLCDRPLDEHHFARVVQKTETEQEEVQHQFWVVREQLATCERELQVLRGEYKQLSQQLTNYERLREERGQLTAQLQATTNVQERLDKIAQEEARLEISIRAGEYAIELQAELQTLDAQLQQLNYNEQTHALARGEVERWRWAEIRQAQIKDAQRRQSALEAQKPEVLTKIADLEKAIADLQANSELARQISALDRHLTELEYDRSAHNEVLTSLRQAQSWQLRYQELQQAQEQHPQLIERDRTLDRNLQEKLASQQAMAAQMQAIVEQLEQMPDPSGEIQILELQTQKQRQQLDEYLATLGRLQQQLLQLENLQVQAEKEQQELQECRRQYRVYQELAQAFGKNGIQALMIENILPQLEAETNQILSRLTGNQLHVTFVTQKTGKSAKSRSSNNIKNAKLIDTLDILIGDARGTRPYETYSGGEAFRINFAIRLALAQLLAQRSGTALQMLIVDEGFGTQDREGCDRLIAAINAIAPDFACILAVTHMPQFKEAFQTRIEVHKTANGSQLSLLM
ncbi:MAG: exonuclease subunit SbcC [Cyanosarcina radialis HA8281-LM2]|jgi:exonuclease SbcC|nr:exonuclease subunit SbcC [Cyanosarcina radialis HA8281-LM2]